MLNLVQDFHWIRPYWLLALVPLALCWLALRRLQQQQSGWRNLVANHLYQHLIVNDGEAGRRPPLWLLALGWLLAVLALAGPTWEKLPQPVYQLQQGKVVVMDMSLSMRATDVSPDRLTRARYKAIDLVNAISEGETGLVAYAGDAYVISPLSSDGHTLTSLIPSLSPEIMPVPGSNPQSGLALAIRLLENAGFAEGEIYWITDGIEPSQVAALSDLILSSRYRLSILGVGSEQGAPIQLDNGELMKDSNGSIVIPKLEPSSLQLLARKGEGRFAPMQADDSDIDYLTSQSSLQQPNKEQAEQDNSFGDQWQEMGPYLLLLLLPLAAYSFRRGILSLLPALVLSASLGTPLLYSRPAQANWWEDLWLNADQQGQKAFNQEHYAEAADQFRDPLWKGSAHYKNGEYQEALEAFSQLDSAEALYNQGNALAQLGQWDAAIDAYTRALQQDPAHQDAAANKSLLEAMQQQQQQQQPQDKNQQGEQDNQDDQTGSDSPGEQSNQNDSGNPGQQSNQSDSGNPGQQSNQNDSGNPGEQSNQNDSGKPDEQSNQNGSDNRGQQQPEQKADANQTSAPQADDEGADQAAPASDETASSTATSAVDPPLSEQQKEEQQRMQNLLRRVPDDPAFLLKRKMLLEHQRRKRETLPNQLQRNW